MKFNPEAHNEDTVQKRIVSKTSNEEFGDCLVINQGNSPMNMDVWYVNSNGKQITQQRIVDTMKKYDRDAAKAVELDKDFENTAPPEWVQGVFDEEQLRGEPFQIIVEKLWSPEHDVHIFRGERSFENRRTAYIVTVTPEGLQLNCIVQLDDRYEDSEWFLQSQGSAVITTEEQQRHIGDDTFTDTVEVINDYIREEEQEGDQLVEDEVIKEYLKAAVAEADLENGEHSFRVEQSQDSGVYRLVVDNTVYYTFVQDSRVIPLWMRDAIQHAEKEGEFDFEADSEYTGEP